MTEFLERSDIVGKYIKHIYTTKWSEDEDGVAGCGVFVELADGTIFPLAGVDFGTVEPIRRIDPNDTILIAADHRLEEEVRGRIVIEVLASELWPAIGLKLTDDKLLIVSDDCSPRRVGPCVLDAKNCIYDNSDYMPYWSQI